MYPSKKEVSCFYCEWVGRKDKAKVRWKKKHPEETFKLRIAENNLSKYHFCTTTTESIRTITSDDEDADKFEEQDQANVIILSPDLPTSTISFAISPS
ncbi:unnamed protein product, partial [Rotaria magnacalcarata]